VVGGAGVGVGGGGVTGVPLGSMCTPRRVVVSGRVLFLCCDGCQPKLLREPAKYLAKLPPP
jgi:Cu(I)/Ag(I) efflux system membrane fusion protein